VTAEIHYAKSGDAYLAYQTQGSGPIDVLWLFAGGIPMEATLEEPRIARFRKEFSSFCRLISHDRRGVGLSDPVTTWDATTLEMRAGDALAVVDAAGSAEVAVVASDLSAGHIATMLSAMHPSRVTALVLNNPIPRVFSAPDYPWGRPQGDLEMFIEVWRKDIETGGSRTLDLFIGAGRADDRLRTWWIRSIRRGMKPGQVGPAMRLVLGTDSRAVLPLVQAQTLLLHDAEPVEWRYPDHARYVQQQIPNSNRIELLGSHMYVYASEAADAFLGEVESFLTGARRLHISDRLLATVLFTDIVGSTERAAAMGDRPWSELLARHNEIVRAHLAEFRGRLVDTAGDGVLATFEGPARAIRCALALRDALRDAGLEIRSGIHTGEIETSANDIGGIAVHIGARVSAMAEAGEIFVSRTVKDLVIGSEISFVHRGSHQLKGVPGDWEIYSVVE
jgi:class 3 adenylate cyclase